MSGLIIFVGRAPGGIRGIGITGGFVFNLSNSAALIFGDGGGEFVGDGMLSISGMSSVLLGLKTGVAFIGPMISFDSVVEPDLSCLYADTVLKIASIKFIGATGGASFIFTSNF